MVIGTAGDKVERIGHRGAPRRHLENTLESFREALRQGADAIELDVHVSRDGVVVVHHDEELGRGVLPPLRRGTALSSLTWSDISAVDLRGGEKIPRLSDVLELVRGNARAYVEVKAGNIAAVVDTVIASEAECAIHSFDHSAIVDARSLARSRGVAIPLGALLDEWPTSLADVVAMTGARDIWPRATLITEARLAEIRSQGCRSIAWTVNDPQLARLLASWGIGGVCTDDLTLL